MRIFVTGASGYVGTAAAAELARRGHALTVLVRSEPERAAAEALGFATVTGGLEATDVLAATAAGAEAIVHAAASDAPAFGPVNAAAVSAMLAALPDGAAFVSHAGTLLFGPTGAAPHDAGAPLAPPPFLMARAQLDEQIIAAGARLRTAIVYAALAYGGRGGAIPNALVAAARTLGFAPYPGDGGQLWSSVHVSDWAALIAQAVERSPPGARYVAAGRAVSIREAAEAAAGALGVEARPADGAALGALGMFGEALRLNQHFAPDRAHAIGWRATIDDLAGGMRDAAAQTA